MADFGRSASTSTQVPPHLSRPFPSEAFCLDGRFLIRKPTLCPLSYGGLGSDQGISSLAGRSLGVWRLRVFIGTDPVTGNPRQATRTFRGTEKKGDSALADLVRDLGQGVVALDTSTLAEFLDRWLNHIASTKSPASRIGGSRSWPPPSRLRPPGHAEESCSSSAGATSTWITATSTSVVRSSTPTVPAGWWAPPRPKPNARSLSTSSPSRSWDGTSMRPGSGQGRLASPSIPTATCSPSTPPARRPRSPTAPGKPSVGCGPRSGCPASPSTPAAFQRLGSGRIRPGRRHHGRTVRP